MKKKLLMSITLLSVSLLGIITLDALSYKVKIESENAGVKTLSEDGATILNTINTSQSNLDNGEVSIDIILDNSKYTEIMYAIDNGNSMNSSKSSLIDAIKSNAKTLENMDNMSQGVVSTANGQTTLVNPDNANIEMQLDNVKSIESGENGGIFDSISKASTAFSQNATNKIIVVFVSDLGTLDSGKVASLKSQVEGYKSAGINIVAYAINMTDKTNFNNIFANSSKHEIETSGISTLNYLAEITKYLPSAKNDITTTISYDNYILNNFEIKDIVASVGNASFDTNENIVKWDISNLETNKTVKLTYTLAVKGTVDASLVDKVSLKTNRQIVVTQGSSRLGNYPADDKIDDQICSPTIKVLSSVNNPKTGIANYIIAGACLLAVAGITLVVINSKNQFDRI